MGAYNRMYFLFTENGLMIFLGGGLIGSCLWYFFINIFFFFPNHLRPGNGCSSASKAKEGLWILLEKLAAAFPFKQLISHEEPIVIKLVRDIKGKSYFLIQE